MNTYVISYIDPADGDFRITVQADGIAPAVVGSDVRFHRGGEIVAVADLGRGMIVTLVPAV